MKNIMNSVRKTTGKFMGRIVSAISNKKTEGFVDSGVKILISVVIGALLLGGLYVLFGDTILPTLTTKIEGLFNYAG